MPADEVTNSFMGDTAENKEDEAATGSQPAAESQPAKNTRKRKANTLQTALQSGTTAPGSKQARKQALHCVHWFLILTFLTGSRRKRSSDE
jgi:hypothetical protein